MGVSAGGGLGLGGFESWLVQVSSESVFSGTAAWDFVLSKGIV